jgi:predicted HNH restriction endonuclease
VSFDRILNPECDELLPLSALRTGKLAEVNWNTQASGISLGAATEELEDLWRRHLQELDFDHSQDEDFSATEGEQRWMLVRHRRREKRLRERKIEQVMKANRDRLPCKVPGCHFDFVEVYGEKLGKGFAHVHHREQLGKRQHPSETRLEDLVIVCPNCHAMIHRFGGNRDYRALIHP